MISRFMASSRELIKLLNILIVEDPLLIRIGGILPFPEVFVIVLKELLAAHCLLGSVVARLNLVMTCCFHKYLLDTHLGEQLFMLITSVMFVVGR